MTRNKMLIKRILQLSNLLQLFVLYAISVLMKRQIGKSRPVSMSIEPVNACNLSCPECPVGNESMSRPKKSLSISDFTNILSAVPSSVYQLVMYFQGEPFLHKSFLDFVRMAKSKGLYTYTSTNAQLINDELAEKIVLSGLDKLVISMDGASQNTYVQYRVGADLETTIAAIKSIVAWKKKYKKSSPYLELQFLVFKFNEHQMPLMKSLASELELDALHFKTAQIYHFEQAENLLPTQEKYRRYRYSEKGELVLKRKLHNRCWRAFSSCVISSEGEVLPCCYDKDANYSFGNIKEKPFQEIWNGHKAIAFRNSIFQNRAQYEMCRNCNE